MEKPMNYPLPSIISNLKGFKLLLILLAVIYSNLSVSQVLPTGFEKIVVAEYLKQPLAMASAPDGRIFLSEKNGAIRIIKNNILLPTPAIKIITDSLGGHTGVAGLAFDPQFKSNGHLYVYYTVPGEIRKSRVSRFKVKHDLILASSEKIILEIPMPDATHIGGALAFGKDEHLYVAVGFNNNPASQNLNNYYGKLLRINKNNGKGPQGNPFNGSEAASRVWCYGFRNPYSISVGKKGDIYIVDVGEKSYEEINDATKKGQNFGWPLVEGPSTGFVSPIYYYHFSSVPNDTSGCALTGGTLLTSKKSNYPKPYHNKFFIMDFCNQWINTLDLSSCQTPIKPTAFGSSLGILNYYLHASTDGNLYYFSLGATGGRLNKIIYQSPSLAFDENSARSGYDASSTESTSEINLYPNPTSGTCHVTLPQNTITSKLTVVNALGEQILKSENSTSNIDIDFSKFEKGLYFVHLEYNGLVKVIKVVNQ